MKCRVPKRRKQRVSITHDACKHEKRTTAEEKGGHVRSKVGEFDTCSPHLSRLLVGDEQDHEIAYNGDTPGDKRHCFEHLSVNILMHRQDELYAYTYRKIVRDSFSKGEYNLLNGGSGERHRVTVSVVHADLLRS